nr:hypothetical protein [Tanacetum cinerariifolium]
MAEWPQIFLTIDHVLCLTGSQSQPLILLEFHRNTFLLGSGSSGGGEGALPSGFDGKSREKWVCEKWAGK